MHLRCRKCRHSFEVGTFQPHHAGTATSETVDDVCAVFRKLQMQASVWYLKEEDYPSWVAEAVEKASWTKGRLCCPRCGGRLGSFDFLKLYMCSCGEHTLPAAHLLKDRMDEVIVRTPDNIVSPPIVRHLVVEGSIPRSTAIPACNTPATKHSNEQRKVYTHCDSLSEFCDKNTESCVSCESNVDCVCKTAFNSGYEHSDKQRFDCSTRFIDSSELTFMNEPSDVGAACVEPLLQNDGIPSECLHCVGSVRQRRQPMKTLGVRSSNTDNRNQAMNWREDVINSLSESIVEQTSGNLNDELAGVVTARVAQTCVDNSQSQHQQMDQQDSIDQVDVLLETGDENPYVLMPETDSQLSDGVSDHANDGEGNDMEEAPEVEIPGELTCSVCLELFYRPHTCRPCDHTFCEPCLRAICRQVPVNTPCPLCRKPINICKLNTGLLEQIGERFVTEYLRRKQELQRWKKTKRFYPLPGQETNQHWIQRELLREGNSGGPFSFIYNVEQRVMTCLNDILVRFAWIIIVFLMHNFIFRISEWVSFSMYLRNTYHFNDFLKGMVVKLLKFGIIHIVRRCFGLTFDRRDILGYFVVYAGLTMVFMYDSATWTQFMYSMVILGSLFTN